MPKRKNSAALRALKSAPKSVRQAIKQSTGIKDMRKRRVAAGKIIRTGRIARGSNPNTGVGKSKKQKLRKAAQQSGVAKVFRRFGKGRDQDSKASPSKFARLAAKTTIGKGKKAKKTPTSNRRAPKAERQARVSSALRRGDPRAKAIAKKAVDSSALKAASAARRRKS